MATKAILDRYFGETIQRDHLETTFRVISTDPLTLPGPAFFWVNHEPGALCVEIGFTWTFPRNQDATVKLKSELISIKF